MITRTPGQGRYARAEREQRWVLRSLPENLGHPVSIRDRYIGGTRLRLRRMDDDDEVTYKLGQKVRPDPDRPEFVHLTNLYLSEQEYEVLTRLGGAEIRKVRRRSTGDGPGVGADTGHPVVVDEFSGALTGLILAEIELGPDQARLAGPARPSLAVADVTDDDRFSGGTLARTTADELRVLLEALGVAVPRP